MRYLLILWTIMVFSQQGHAQSIPSDTTNHLIDNDSLRFHLLLDSVKIFGITDSTQYADIRLAGIVYMHQLDNKQALPFLDIAYSYNEKDSITNRLLYEVLIMKINRQKNPQQNINDIKTFRQKYTFLKDSVSLQEIIFRDALTLLSTSFEKDSLSAINKYYDLASKELEYATIKAKLLAIENTEIMFFNVALKNYLAKNYSKTAQILKVGSMYFPNNKDMQALKKHIEKKN